MTESTVSYNKLLAKAINLSRLTAEVQASAEKASALQWKDLKVLLEKIAEDIKSFFTLKVITTVDQVTYSTAIDERRNVTSIFPETINTDLFKRHNDLVDTTWKNRTDMVTNIINLIIEAIKAVFKLS